MADAVKEFDDETIHAIFGAEAAEDEDIARLRQYYFKGAIFKNITAQLPLRVLVGHKGIGKSALFTVAIQEDMEQGQVPVLIQPNDIAGLAVNASGFIQLINDWKTGLYSIIARKALHSIGVGDETLIMKATRSGTRLVATLLECIRVVHQQLDLQPAQKQLLKNLNASQSINVYIDDLDRGWEGRKEDITRVSALLNAVRDINKENKGIRFKIALRSDVYFLVRTSDESTDKTEGAVIWYGWTNHEILALLVKRIETFFGREANEEKLIATDQRDLARYLGPVMENRFHGHGKWKDIPTHRMLMSLIRKRPRDLVKLCTLAAKRSQKRHDTKIHTNDFNDIFEEYSQGRMQDTINEYRTELPDIQRLLMGMKPSQKERREGRGYIYSTDMLIKKLGDVTQQGRFMFKNGAIANERDLAHFLYKINFLTARKELPSEEILRRYFEEHRYISGRFADFGFDWEVHPAYRWALQPDNIFTILEEMGVSAEDA